VASISMTLEAYLVATTDNDATTTPVKLTTYLFHATNYIHMFEPET
jgi:hypothetical protein